MAEEKKKISANDILDKIIRETYVRHAETDEKDFKKLLGFDEDRPESEVVNTCLYNLCVNITKELVKMSTNIALMTAKYKLLFDEVEKNGRNEEN